MNNIIRNTFPGNRYLFIYSIKNHKSSGAFVCGNGSTSNTNDFPRVLGLAVGTHNNFSSLFIPISIIPSISICKRQIHRLNRRTSNDALRSLSICLFCVVDKTRHDERSNVSIPTRNFHLKYFSSSKCEKADSVCSFAFASSIFCQSNGNHRLDKHKLRFHGIFLFIRFYLIFLSLSLSRMNIFSASMFLMSLRESIKWWLKWRRLSAQNQIQTKIFTYWLTFVDYVIEFDFLLHSSKSGCNRMYNFTCG